LSYLEIDGKQLIDPGVIPVGGMNSSAYNTSDKWSDDVAGNTYGGASMPKSKLFNGALDNNVIANSGTTLTFSPSGLSSISSLRIYGSSYTRNANGIVVNGTDYTSSFPQGGNSVAAWVTIPETSLTSVAWSTTSSGLENGSLFAIEVDGKLLVDNDQTPPNVPAAACTVRANPTAGFSIVKVPDPNSTEIRAHGLNKKPDLIIGKALTGSQQWHIYHSAFGKDYYGTFQTNNFSSSDQWGSQEPTSKLFYVKSNTGSGANFAGGMIYYIWNAVENYSAFGSFEGNGSSDGPFVYTGFKPAWLMIKNADDSGETWTIHDSTRDVDNPAEHRLLPNSNNAETTGTSARFKDLLSNGFKIRGTSGEQNTNGRTYIYAAFAENPFKTARAA